MSNEEVTVAVAALSGDQLDALVALRAVLAKQIDICDSSRDLASLARQLMLVLASIESVANARVPEALNPLEELRKRRAASAAGGGL